ncbi:HAMP domain-containing protein [Aggregicoccus sp. 17bor-14]|uniref:sensor histidine kinase n=1 Tax=Myxococcaceae TaxID=31 RepID=UPI00129C3200|nr:MULTISPECIES: HAMP domain-containing sensor histidine kinase [Myxococcaceae]MBF5045174.1 HAMP domain-containing protein [Simulacricoccus sp. 17bor-14]MRI90915.1 HAMP domain-containing protein [Aggregicoccus sp. 17bor-14]
MIAPPRAFRRRLLTVMLITGLVPLLVLGWVGQQALSDLLSISVAPVEGVLERVSADLAREGRSTQEIREARLHLAQAELARRALVARVPLWAGAVVLTAALALATAALVLGRALTRPVETLTRGMEAFSRGDLAHALPAPTKPRDELDFLLLQFNQMGEELRLQRERLTAAVQVAAWQDVARALAHELKNPLTAMRLSLARLARPEAPLPPAQAEALTLLQDEVELLLRMTQSFSTFARLPAPRFAPVSLRPLLEDVCRLYREQGPVAVELTPGPDAQLQADADGLRRLFGNLVKNAAEATPTGAAPVRVSFEPDGVRVRVKVEDAGPGVPGILEGAALTRGLFSTKPGGSGLGLPIAQKIAQEHGATLRLLPREGGGTVALVELPRLESPTP